MTRPFRGRSRGAWLSLLVLVPLAATGLLSAFLAAGAAAAPASEADWAASFAKARTDNAVFAVESVEEFRKISLYYQDVLSDGIAVHSFELPSGDQIRCVDVTTQRSLAASGLPLQSAPGTLPGGFPGQLPRGPQTLADRSGAEFGLDGSPDARGNARTCPATSFPKLMPRLSNLYKLRRLNDLFRKVPEGVLGKPAIPPASVTPDNPRLPPEIQATPVHEYAHAYQWANNIGMRADFNLWSPFVEQAEEFSLSQLWVARGNTSDNSLQTAETGWQRCRLIYGDDVSHLFIYHTRANYTANSGCYNLSCTAFVQTDSSVVIGGSWSNNNYSSLGGNQYDISLAYYRDPSPPNNWWLMYGSTWVGYFPNSLYNSAGIANYCDHIDYGGEIVNEATGGLHTTTVMGSGRFPSEGFGYAAYVKRVQYWDMSAALQNATGLTPTATNPSYYDIALVSSSDTNWYQYFYFGGPGRTASSCSYSLAPASASSSASGGNGSFAVSTSSGCSWSSTSNSAWLTVTSGSGSGSGSVSYAVAANGSSSSRTGTITVGGQVFTLTQSGTTSGCTADANTLCLSNNRFKVQASYKNYAGNTGMGTAVKMTDLAGWFWFSDASTPEILAKFVSFCSGSSGNWSIYASGLTDVQVTFMVTDTKTGLYKEYKNSLGNRFCTIGDGPFSCP